MFHQRFASELRSSSATPSSYVPLLPVSPSALPAIPDHPPGHPGLARRVVEFSLSASHAAAQTRDVIPKCPSRRVVNDLILVSAPRIAAFLAEAAVLVLVLGLLDRLLVSHHLELRWMGVTCLISFSLLSGSIAADLWIRIIRARG